MPLDPTILGGALFLAGSGALLYAGAVAGVVREALRPERRSVAWAIARGTPTEPSAWGLPHREWTHRFEGAECPVFDLGDEDPDAPTAIVLHGFARSRYDALARLAPLLPHARRFILPDLPGHGDATGRATRLGSGEERFVASVAAATSGPLLVVGHSLGATIAIRTAADHAIAPRVRGVVALAPYDRLRTPLGARLELRGMPRAALLAPTLGTLSALGIREHSTLEAARSLRAPLAVVAGAHDPVVPVRESAAIAEAAARARVFTVQEGRHDDFHTLGRDAMREALAWIDSTAD
jgi:pimeloyl-ACP methyl ester carboxylesterase